jgi:hypothetical protein
MNEKSDSEVLVPVEHKVEIGGKKFVVNPFSVKDIISFTRDLIDGLAAIKEKYPAMEFKSEDAFKYFPAILDEAPRLFGLLARSIGKDKDWLESQTDLVGVSKLFAIVAEINDFGMIISNFQEGWSKLKHQTIRASAVQ